MVKKDKRIDAYIEKAQPFAKPILEHIRELVHKAVPDAEETIKWSFPHFDVNGSIMCSMASFKQHCAIVFPRASLMSDKHGLFKADKVTAMGHMGQIKNIKDLPKDKMLMDYMKESAEQCRQGIKMTAKKPDKKKELVIPDYFIKAINKNKKAQKTFDSFSYSHKKEYIEWITEAKTDETRNRRMETAIEWMAEGKGRNWKYSK